MTKYQWFKVTQGKETYSELAIVASEDTNFCTLSNGKKIPVADKCKRGEYPLRPQNVKWRGLQHFYKMTYNITIEISDNGTTYISTERIARTSMSELLGHCRFLDSYNRDKIINDIMALANLGFTRYGLDLYVKGFLDRKGACARYCHRAHVDPVQVFKIVNPI